MIHNVCLISREELQCPRRSSKWIIYYITYNPTADTTCGSRANYGCNIGYVLSDSGDLYRFCEEDITWNGTAKNCSSSMMYTTLGKKVEPKRSCFGKRCHFGGWSCWLHLLQSGIILAPLNQVAPF